METEKLSLELKQKIWSKVEFDRTNFTGSDAKYAKSIGINAAQYSRIHNGDFEKVISDAQWYSIARQKSVNISDAPEWIVAETPVYTFITMQLEACQKNGISALLCDLADIGKTFTAKHYADTHRNVVYVDCSQYKSRSQLIRYIAMKFGICHIGQYKDVYEDLVYYLRGVRTPMVILDEAGDLEYPAFLELKALWNATEHACGWYMMGADGLKEKIRRSIEKKKVGYTELFSRYGTNFGHVMPEDAKDREKFSKAQAAMIIKANAPEETDVQKLIASTKGSLRRCYIEIMKMNTKTKPLTPKG